MSPEARQESSAKERREPLTAWSPLRQPVFRALWTATLVSNIGTWVQNTATAWLMTSIAPSAVMVSLVQTATSLPIFLLALPAGALADVVDRRRLLLFTQGWMLTMAALLGALNLLGFTTPWMLLTLTLLLGTGAALNAPAWQAIMPELVPRRQIPSAVALNSAGFNAARVIGPALGGLIVGALGVSAAFLINAASYVFVVVALFLWQRPVRESALPAEHMMGAMRTGVRYVRHAAALRAVLVHSAVFIFGGSALMALLPLLARVQLGLDSLGYGLLLGAFGLGAIAGMLMLPWLRQRFSVDMLAALAKVLFAAVLILAALVHHFMLICGALIVGGAAWLTLLSSLNSSVQSGVPSWVRGRALALYMLIFFGGNAGGSLLWGTVAGFWGIPAAFLLAALTLIAGLALTTRVRLSSSQSLDLNPSMHWPVPQLLVDSRPEDGPVLITVEYRIDPARWHEFGRVMRRMRHARFRGGALRWDLFVDALDPQRHVESFIVESWIEHLRQHERVTVADRDVERLAHSYHIGENPPLVSHYIAKSLPR